MPVSGAAGLAKASLRVDAGATKGEELSFLFNPTEYTIAKSATWNRPPAAGAKSATKPEFGGTNPQTVQMEIFFDGWEKHDLTISEAVAKLIKWTKPTDESRSKDLPQPPVLVFDWGANKALEGYRGYLKSVSAKYTMFDTQGNPLRVSANITLEEVPTEPTGQNPTSGSLYSRRTHVLSEGETLHWLSYREYGDPTLWRALAQFNEIDDPFRIPVGTRLLVPSLSEASRIA